MKSISGKILMPVGLVASLMLNGCTTMLRDEGVKNVIEGNVLRMTVDWGETPTHSWTPVAYNVEANSHNWAKETNQYRWVNNSAILRRDIWGRAFRIALVPDEVPLLQRGDLIDVYVPLYETIDYNALKAPTVLRLVCRKDDSTCMSNAEKTLGGKNEVVSKGKPDMSNMTFSKVYDLEGKRPK